jgi:CRP/FNR family transcriptional regulator, cyclic AMP receptor protein
LPNSPPGSGQYDPLAFLSQPGAGKTLESYQKNRKIFSQGDVADSVFFIRSGKVKLAVLSKQGAVLSKQGKEAVIGLLKEGQFFGEGCLDGAKLRGATSCAVEECQITSITRAAMLAAQSAMSPNTCQ